MIILDNMQPGDVIAFSGRGLLSSAISAVTDSAITHVGVVVRHEGRLQLLESTTLADGRSGVALRDVGERVVDYDGRAWWYPLTAEAARRFDLCAFEAGVAELLGRRYDFRQVAQFLVRRWCPFLAARLPWFRENLGRVFCSELVAVLEKRARVIDVPNCSAISPGDLVKLPVFDSPRRVGGPALLRPAA